jgi:hypothetical protein
MSEKEKPKLSDYKFDSIIVNPNMPKENIEAFLLEFQEMLEAEKKQGLAFVVDRRVKMATERRKNR